MKFLVDAQLPPALAVWLRELGHEAQHDQEIGLRDAEDSPIWQHAMQESAIVLTKDEDFAVRVRQGGSAPVIVWLRIGNGSNRALREWFLPLLPSVVQKIQAGHGFIEVR